MEQRWLTMDGICAVLQMDRKTIEHLVRRGKLVTLPGFKRGSRARFLDPTPEYAEKLRLAIATKSPSVPRDFDLTALLTLQEVAAILGIKPNNALRKSMQRAGVKHKKVGRYYLFSVADVRDMLWKRRGRKLAHQRAPFLLADIIRFFLSHCETEAAVVPTDLDFANDDLLMKKLARLNQIKDPLTRESAMKELLAKVSLAKSTVQNLE